MNNHKSNKLAWEEAFHNRKPGWGDNVASKINKEHYLFLDQVLLEELKNHDLEGKSIAQFCCNNGRELLSIFSLGPSFGVGFDIADNMIAAANTTAKELNYNCKFVATDILDIDPCYHNTFDYIFVTTGAITWFEDLSAFFQQASLCLKQGGYLILHEMHPVTGMLPMEGEEEYNSDCPNKLVYSYFRQEPWVENNGMGYMSDSSKEYHETFFSYSHPFADIFNAAIDQGLSIKKLKESDIDYSGSFIKLSGKGTPLSFILVVQK